MITASGRMLISGSPFASVVDDEQPEISKAILNSINVGINKVFVFIMVILSSANLFKIPYERSGNVDWEEVVKVT